MSDERRSRRENETPEERHARHKREREARAKRNETPEERHERHKRERAEKEARAKKPEAESPLTFEALADEFDEDAEPAAEGERTPKPKKKGLDDNRPILVNSGYQPPSKKSYLAAFLLFGFAGIYLMYSTPQIREIMWPFEAKGPEYSDPFYQPPVQETNRIRDTRNISKLNILYQVPFFVITWGFVLAYVGAIGLMIVRFFPFIGDWLRKKLSL